MFNFLMFTLAMLVPLGLGAASQWVANKVTTRFWPEETDETQPVN